MTTGQQQSNSASYADLIKSFSDVPDHVQRGQFNEDGSAQQGQAAQIAKAASFNEYMEVAYPDSYERSTIVRQMKAAIASSEHMKDGVGTVDIGPMLQSVISGRDPLIINEDTPALNAFEGMGGPELYTDDWIYRNRDRRQTEEIAPPINPEDSVTNLPDVKLTRSQKENVLMFWAQPTDVSFVADAQAQQQDQTDLLRQEIDPILVALRKAREYYMLRGIEQRNPTPPNITQMGGLFSRTETFVTDLANQPLTADDIEGTNNGLNARVGRRQKMVLCNEGTIGVVRAIETDRFGGEDSAAYRQTQTLLGQKMTQMKIMVDRYYDPDMGPPIAFVQSYRVANNALFITLDPMFCPKPVYFRIQGKRGYWMFVNYNKLTNLRTGHLIMDGGTMDDPAEETRALYLNVAA